MSLLHDSSVHMCFDSCFMLVGTLKATECVPPQNVQVERRIQFYPVVPPPLNILCINVLSCHTTLLAQDCFPYQRIPVLSWWTLYPSTAVVGSSIPAREVDPPRSCVVFKHRNSKQVVGPSSFSIAIGCPRQENVALNCLSA